MAPKPWSDADSAQLRELHASGMALWSISKKMGRSSSTVSKWSKRLGLSFERGTVAKAAAAHHIDNKARRAAIEERLLVKAAELLDETERGELVFSFGGADNTYNDRQLDAMTPRSKKDLIQAIGSLLVSANKLHELNSEGRDLPAVDAWLAGMLGDESTP
nr:MAG TPA: InsA C-terminal domain [Caudoviricetes sp.]